MRLLLRSLNVEQAKTENNWQYGLLHSAIRKKACSTIKVTASWLIL